MTSKSPTIRTIFQYLCRDCGKESMVRFPYNPMGETMDIVQAVPLGWMLVHDGNNPQTPVAVCDKCVGGSHE